MSEAKRLLDEIQIEAQFIPDGFSAQHRMNKFIFQLRLEINNMEEKEKELNDKINELTNTIRNMRNFRFGESNG